MSSPKQLVKDGYNRCAQKYEADRDRFKNQQVLDILAGKLTPGARILDIGCGSGVPVDRYLIGKGLLVTGIDISEEQIRLAVQNNPQGNFLVQDMAGLELPASSFDAIVSFYAIIHLPREEQPELFRKIHTLLKRGGWILVTMGTSDWEGTEEDFYGVKMFWSHYGMEKNIEMVRSAGFEIELDTVDSSGGEKHLVILAQKRAD